MRPFKTNVIYLEYGVRSDVTCTAVISWSGEVYPRCIENRTLFGLSASQKWTFFGIKESNNFRQNIWKLDSDRTKAGSIWNVGSLKRRCSEVRGWMSTGTRIKWSWGHCWTERRSVWIYTVVWRKLPPIFVLLLPNRRAESGTSCWLINFVLSRNSVSVWRCGWRYGVWWVRYKLEQIQVSALFYFSTDRLYRSEQMYLRSSKPAFMQT